MQRASKRGGETTPGKPSPEIDEYFNPFQISFLKRATQRYVYNYCTTSSAGFGRSNCGTSARMPHRTHMPMPGGNVLVWQYDESISSITAYHWSALPVKFSTVPHPIRMKSIHILSKSLEDCKTPNPRKETGENG